MSDLQFWQLIALGLLFGLSQAFFLPAYQSIAPQLVEIEALPSANALNGLTREIGILVGPALGAVLVANFSTASAFAFDALTFLISALCLLAVRVPMRRPRRLRRHPRRNRLHRHIIVALGDHRNCLAWQCLARAL